MKLPPDFVFPEGTKSLGINLAALSAITAAPAANSAPLAVLVEAMGETVPKPSKYRNQRTQYNGRTYDSKAEANDAEAYDLQKARGEIIEWVPQPIFHLAGLWYRADFLIVGHAETFATDRKGVETQRFRDIRKLWKLHARLDLHVVKRTGTEIIRPKRRNADV